MYTYTVYPGYPAYPEYPAYPYPLRMGFLILFLLCALVSFAAALLNGHVFFITSCHIERTFSTVWFLNRAVADLIFIIFFSLHCTSMFVWNSQWPERLSSTITSLHLFSSAFFLMAISVYRCILVARPAWAWDHCTPRLALWVVLGLWVLSLGFALRYSDLWDDRFEPPSTGRRKAAVAIQFLVGFMIPLALILTFYVLLAAKLRRNRLSQSTKPLKVLLGLIPTFLISWFPYHVICFLYTSDMYRLHLRIIERSFVCAPAFFSSCLNPILYLTMEDEILRFRQRAHNPQSSNNSGPELILPGGS